MIDSSRATEIIVSAYRIVSGSTSR